MEDPTVAKLVAASVVVAGDDEKKMGNGERGCKREGGKDTCGQRVQGRKHRDKR